MRSAGPVADYHMVDVFIPKISPAVLSLSVTAIVITAGCWVAWRVIMREYEICHSFIYCKSERLSGW